jgi:hypothetical protein
VREGNLASGAPDASAVQANRTASWPIIDNTHKTRR